MNKRQKLIHTVAKCYCKSIEKKSGINISFKKQYRDVKFAYKNETNDYIKDILKWIRGQYISDIY